MILVSHAVHAKRNAQLNVFLKVTSMLLMKKSALIVALAKKFALLTQFQNDKNVR
jgi:hypothetical protein